MSPANVFDNIESAHEYIGMLREALDDAQDTIDLEIACAADGPPSRHLDALRIVDFKLAGLRQHLGATGLLLNDLRTLRRYLFEERLEPAGRAESDVPAAAN